MGPLPDQGTVALPICRALGLLDLPGGLLFRGCVPGSWFSLPAERKSVPVCRASCVSILKPLAGLHVCNRRPAFNQLLGDTVMNGPFTSSAFTSSGKRRRRPFAFKTNEILNRGYIRHDLVKLTLRELMAAVFRERAGPCLANIYHKHGRGPGQP
jgi:hypothetical protein